MNVIDLQKNAIRCNFEAFFEIENPSEELLLWVIESITDSTPYVLSTLESIPEKIQLSAVRNCRDSLLMMNNVCDEALELYKSTWEC